MTGTAAVLLVDDRPENLLAMRAVLEPLPCRMVSVTSGEEALKALLHQDFAVVLLDVQMPGMDGFETAELIKQRERTRHVPIIFVTAISKERGHVYRGYAAGAVDYVFKPYDPGVLRSKVAVFLELEAKSRAAAHSEAVLRAAFDFAPIGMARLDLDGRVAEANRALAGLLGLPAADLRDRLLESLAHPQDAALLAEQRVRRFPGPASVEARLMTATGAEVPCVVSLSPARPGGGVPETVIVQVQDLRERLRADAERTERLREQLARVEAERSAERLRTIQRISDAALGTLAFDDLVRELLARTVEALHVDTAAVVLDEADGELVVYQTAGHAPVQRRTERADAGSVLGDAVASKLDTVLVVDGEQIGALHVGSLFARAFSSADQALLELAADRAAAGIQRARLYQREHRIAEELQRSLLPAELPVVAGLTTAAWYSPAGPGSQVGGDWYDVVVQPDGRLLLVIGDVAGRGISAASTMGQLRSAMRAYALDGHPPAALLERLNAFQLELRTRGMTTVGLISVDPATGDVTYAKAGHPPPLVVEPDGTTRWLDQARGIPVGAIEDTTYTEATTTLAPGTTLVLYTDGLVEVRREPIDRGLERLQRAAVAALSDEGDAVCDTILQGTLANPEVDDDVTLLVLRTAGTRGRPPAAYPRRREDLPARRLGDEATVVALHGGPRASGAARRALDGAFAGLVDETVLADLRIVLAEVVSNAVVHGGAEAIELRLAAGADVLRAEVSHAGPPFGTAAGSPPEQPGGFGLFLLDQLSSRWGHDDRDGVVVWFEVDRAGVPAASA